MPNIGFHNIIGAKRFQSVQVACKRSVGSLHAASRFCIARSQLSNLPMSFPLRIAIIFEERGSSRSPGSSPSPCSFSPSSSPSSSPSLCGSPTSPLNAPQICYRFEPEWKVQAICEECYERNRNTLNVRCILHC